VTATPSIKVRSATAEDAPAIFAIIDRCAANGTVLPRNQEDIGLTIASFVVGEVDGRMLACAALVACGSSDAEIRSVAVDPQSRGTGLGRAVVEYVVSEAQALGVERLFLLTRLPGFFERVGFQVIDPEHLPDTFLADLVHVQQRSLFNKYVMTRSLLRMVGGRHDNGAAQHDGREAARERVAALAHRVAG
jgi:N-acetylglutamate synthase-like GNAT family acetyltransferase